MLPRTARLNRSADFRRVTRSGVRAGRSTLVVHAVRSEPGDVATSDVRIGLVVSKAVGNAVARNRVKRRLRHLSADRIGLTPGGTDLVVRALPASATSAALGDDLASAWAQVLGKLARRTPAAVSS